MKRHQMLTCKAQENTRDIINRVVERANMSKPVTEKTTSYKPMIKDPREKLSKKPMTEVFKR